MKPVTKVIEIKEPPQLKKAAIQQGIRDKAAAENWGRKNGYTIVYFMPKKQKVYAERLTMRVDAQAKEIERQMDELREQLEMAL